MNALMLSRHLMECYVADIVLLGVVVDGHTDCWPCWVLFLMFQLLSCTFSIMEIVYKNN